MLFFLSTSSFSDDDNIIERLWFSYRIVSSNLHAKFVRYSNRCRAINFMWKVACFHERFCNRIVTREYKFFSHVSSKEMNRIRTCISIFISSYLSSVCVLFPFFSVFVMDMVFIYHDV